MSFPATSEFHPRCPFCSDGHGLARSVEIAGTTRTVTYRCDHCQQKWSVADRVPFSLSFWSRD
jgi:transposase-like protein